MEDALVAFLTPILSSHPILVSILSVIGILRAINKPLFALLHAYVLSTPTPKDDSILDAVEKSPITKAVLFVLDWTTSIKIPPKAPDVPVLPKGIQ